MSGQTGNKAREGTGQLNDLQVREIRRVKELYLERKRIYKEAKKAAEQAKYAMLEAGKTKLAERMGVSIRVVDSVWRDTAYNHVI